MGCKRSREACTRGKPNGRTQPPNGGFAERQERQRKEAEKERQKSDRLKAEVAKLKKQNKELQEKAGDKGNDQEGAKDAEPGKGEVAERIKKMEAAIQGLKAADMPYEQHQKQLEVYRKAHAPTPSTHRLLDSRNKAKQALKAAQEKKEELGIQYEAAQEAVKLQGEKLEAAERALQEAVAKDSSTTQPGAGTLLMEQLEGITNDKDIMEEPGLQDQSKEAAQALVAIKDFLARTDKVKAQKLAAKKALEEGGHGAAGVAAVGAAVIPPIVTDGGPATEEAAMDVDPGAEMDHWVECMGLKAPNGADRDKAIDKWVEAQNKKDGKSKIVKDGGKFKRRKSCG